MRRCQWATMGNSPLMIEYHDKEWGVPVHDDRTLFEFLALEGAQAGLSWQTVLSKRENYRKAFHAFEPAKIARFKRGDVQFSQAQKHGMLCGSFRVCSELSAS